MEARCRAAKTGNVADVVTPLMIVCHHVFLFCFLFCVCMCVFLAPTANERLFFFFIRLIEGLIDRSDEMTDRLLYWHFITLSDIKASYEYHDDDLHLHHRCPVHCLRNSPFHCLR